MADEQARRRLADNPLAWIVVGTLLALWGYGVFHAYSAHDRKTLILAVVLPPYGMYMAAPEWHGDEAEMQMTRSKELTAEEVVQYCKEDQDQRARTGLTQTQYDVFCDCTWAIVFETMDGYTGDEARRNQVLNAVLNQASQNCMASAQYLGEGGRTD